MAKVSRVQSEFRRMMRDHPRSAMLKGTCWTIQDAIPNLGAPLRTRGGWTHYSDDVSAAGGSLATANYLYSGAYLDQITTPRLVAVTDTARLFRVATDGTGDVTDIGAVTTIPWFYPQLNGIVVLCSSTGAAAPKKYDGTTLGNLGGSPPSAAYAATWKSLMLLGGGTAATEPQRLYFSTTDNNAETWDTTNVYWDFTYPITSLAPLRNAVLVFHDQYASRLRGSTPPPGGDLIADDPLFNVGCNQPWSIQTWNEQIVWANEYGIYITDGIVPNDLTRLCGMKTYWQDLMSQATDRWLISSGLIRDHYVYCVYRDADIAVKDAGMIDLRTNAWVKLTNLGAGAFWRSTALSNQEKLFFGRLGSDRVAELSTMWTPSATYKNDGDGDPVQMMVETPFYEFGRGIDLVRDTYVTYDLRDADADDPTLEVSYVTDPSSSSYTTAATLAETTEVGRRRATINRTGLGFGLKLTQANAASDGRLYAVDADGYGLEEDRLV